MKMLDSNKNTSTQQENTHSSPRIRSKHNLTTTALARHKVAHQISRLIGMHIHVDRGIEQDAAMNSVNRVACVTLGEDGETLG